VRPPGAYVSAKVRALVDLLVETFGQDPIWDRTPEAPKTIRPCRLARVNGANLTAVG